MMALLAQEDLLVQFSKYQTDTTSPILGESNFTAFLSEVQKAKPAEIEEALKQVRNMREPLRITKPTAPIDHQVLLELDHKIRL